MGVIVLLCMLIPSPVAFKKTPSKYRSRVAAAIDEGVIGILEHGVRLPINQGVLHLRVLLDQSLEHFPDEKE
jgi:hypothetical protein